MSPAPDPTTAPPAAPAGRPACARRGWRGRFPAPDRRLWVVLLLVLAALLGTGASGALTGGAELRPATASPAPDPGAETHDPAGTEAGLPGRSRRHRTGIRPVRRPRRLPYGARGRRRGPAAAPVPAPRCDALRCVVMRC